jgi:hypothetical protein
MLKTIVLAMSIAIPSGAAQSSPPRVVTMQELTVPAEGLPTGCVLSPGGTVRLDGNKVRMRSWAGLRIPSNPWAGTDRPLVASIRERMEPTVTPDGPPPSRSEAASFRLHFADGVEEAYAAIYEQSETELIVVYASRFASSEKAVESRSYSGWSNNPRVIRVAMGPIVAMIQGNAGACFDAVGAHLRSLEK